MGWQYIRDIMKKKYDIIFYCDATFYPRNNIDWYKYGTDILNNESGIIQQIHHIGNNAYLECDLIVNTRKDTLYNMTKMKDFLKNKNFPEDHVMMENTAFGFNPNNNKIIYAFSDFWSTYSKHKITYRDQPFWAYFSWKHNIKPIIFSYDYKNHLLCHTLFKYIGSSHNHSYI